MKKLFIIIFIYLNLTLHVNSQSKTIKEFFLTCEGVLNSTYTGDQSPEKTKFYQDIKVSINKNDKGDLFLSYDNEASSDGLMRPGTALSAALGNTEAYAEGIQSSYIYMGLSAIKEGWTNGVIKVHSRGKEFHKKTKARIMEHSEVLNLNLNTLSLRMKFELSDSPNIIQYNMRSRCSKNKELLDYLNSLGTNTKKYNDKKKSGTFKKTLGNILGK